MAPTMVSVFLPLLAATGTAFAAKFSPSSISHATAGFGNTLPNKFIVEVENVNDIPGKRDLDTRSVSSNSFFFRILVLGPYIAIHVCLVTPSARLTDPDKQAHEIVYDSLRKRDLGFTVEKEFDEPDLFVGSVLTLDVSISPAPSRQCPSCSHAS